MSVEWMDRVARQVEAINSLVSSYAASNCIAFESDDLAVLKWGEKWGIYQDFTGPRKVEKREWRAVISLPIAGRVDFLARASQFIREYVRYAAGASERAEKAMTSAREAVELLLTIAGKSS